MLVKGATRGQSRSDMVNGATSRDTDTQENKLIWSSRAKGKQKVLLMRPAELLYRRLDGKVLKHKKVYEM